MLSREMHLEQVNRFHDLLGAITAKVDAINDVKPKEEFDQERYEYLKAYVDTMKIWMVLDDATDEAKNEMDIIEYDLKIKKEV